MIVFFSSSFYFHHMIGIYCYYIYYYLMIIVLMTKGEQISSMDEMLNIKQNIQNNSNAFCYGAHSNTVKSFIGRTWKGYLGNHVALVYPFCLKTNELGNRIGNYFNELACADVIGADFITIHSQFDITGSMLAHNNATVEPLIFLKSLPEIIIHKSPQPFDIAKTRAQEFCRCTQYCWQDRNAPWLKALPSIKNILLRSIQIYYDHKKDVPDHIHSSDLSNAKESEILPIIPEVAIQYRCGDNLGFNYMYGILPFYVIKNRIPLHSKTIYVLSDHPARSVHSPYAPRCQLIIKTLFEYLKFHFPLSTIVVKRGGDMFLDYARLAFANITICSASTYCLWPAIASNGIVHFPMTYLIAGVDNANLTVHLTSNFHWITEVEIITNFNKLRPWQKIIDILVGNTTNHII